MAAKRSTPPGGARTGRHRRALDPDAARRHRPASPDRPGDHQVFHRNDVLGTHADTARVLFDSLEQQSGTWTVGAVAGQVEIARAEVLWASGRHEEVLCSFRRAIEVLWKKRALMEVATTRLDPAQALAAHGEPAAAGLELRAAEAKFEASDAIGYRSQCHALRESMSRSAAR